MTHSEPPSDAARVEEMRRRLAEQADLDASLQALDGETHYDTPLTGGRAGGGGLGLPPETGPGGTSDTRPLTLTGAEADADGGAVTVTFSRNVDGASAEEEERFTISRSVGIGGLSVQGNRVRLILSRSLATGIDYVLTVSQGLLATDGTTVLSGTRTATLSVSGFRFLRAYASDSRRFVTLEFSDSPNVPIADPGQRFVMHRLDAGTWVAYAWGSTIARDGNTITLQMAAQLAESTTYSVRINDSYAHDAVPLTAGDPPVRLAGQRWQAFSTSDPAPPSTGFRVVRAAARLNRRQVELEFSEPVSSTSARVPGRFVIEGVRGALGVSTAGGTLIVLTTGTRLAFNTEYSIRISRGLVSNEGTELPVTSGSEFTRVFFTTDAAQPFGVVSLMYDWNTGDLVITFNRDVLESAAETASNWSIDGGLSVGTPEVTNGIEVRLPITGTGTLEVYTLTIGAMVTDEDGTSLPASDRTQTFVRAAPLNNEGVGFVDGNVRLRFSEQVAEPSISDFSILPNTGNLGGPNVPVPPANGTGVLSVRQGGAVPGTPSSHYLILEPSVDMPPGSSWYVLLSPELVSVRGGASRISRTFRYTLNVPGTTSSFRISSAHEGGVVVGAGAAFIEVHFTDTVDLITAVRENFFPQAGTRAEGGATAVPVIDRVSARGRVVTITFMEPLVNGARYTIRVATAVQSTRRQRLTGTDTAGPFTAGFASLTVRSVTLEGSSAVVTCSHDVGNARTSHFAISMSRTGVATPSVSGVSVNGNVVTVRLSGIAGGTAYAFVVRAGLPSSLRSIRPLESDYNAALQAPAIDPLGLRSSDPATFVAPRTVDIAFSRDIQSGNLAGLFSSGTRGIGVSTAVRKSGSTDVARIVLDRNPTPGATYEIDISPSLRSSDRQVAYTGPESVTFTVPSSGAAFEATIQGGITRDHVFVTFTGRVSPASLRRLRSYIQVHAGRDSLRTEYRTAYTELDGVTLTIIGVIFPITSRRFTVTVSNAFTNTDGTSLARRVSASF